MQSYQMMKTTMKTALLHTLTLPQNNITEIEGVDRMGIGTEEREIEGVESETEGVESENEGVDNGFLPPEIKGCSPRNPPKLSTTVKK